MGYWGDMPCSTGDLKYVEYGEEEQAVDDQGDEDVTSSSSVLRQLVSHVLIT